MTSNNNKDSARGPEYLWFDIDDTLWDMSGNSNIVLADVYASDPTVRRYYGGAGLQAWLDCYHDVNRELWDAYNRGAIARDYLRSERFARPLRMAGCGADEAAGASARLDVEYLDRLGACTALVPGARELLERLHARGYRMGLLSNGFREVQHRKLASSGIAGYFDTVVLSDDIGINKPDRRLFDHALERAGVAACDSLLIGDNEQTDIAGALAAGWRALWFNPAGRAMPAALEASERFAGSVAALADIAAVIEPATAEKGEKTI